MISPVIEAADRLATSSCEPGSLDGSAKVFRAAFEAVLNLGSRSTVFLAVSPRRPRLPVFER